MIRKFENRDLDEVMDLWLNMNIQTHDFVNNEYWLGNYNNVRACISEAEIFVFEADNSIKAFLGMDDGYIEGIFVSTEAQSQGIGRELLEKAKDRYSELSLAVYKKNEKAIRFYQREGFAIKEERMDINTGEIEFCMFWEK